jgi:hypothetical protein
MSDDDNEDDYSPLDDPQEETIEDEWTVKIYDRETDACVAEGSGDDRRTAFSNARKDLGRNLSQKRFYCLVEKNSSREDTEDDDYDEEETEQISEEEEKSRTEISQAVSNFKRRLSEFGSMDKDTKKWILQWLDNENNFKKRDIEESKAIAVRNYFKERPVEAHLIVAGMVSMFGLPESEVAKILQLKMFGGDDD